MTSSIDEAAFLMMETVFAVLMFVSCYFSYLLPIKMLQRKRLGHQRLHEPVPLSSSPAHPQALDDRNAGPSEHAMDEHEERAEKVVGFANCFGAGVFLSVCFMAVMPVVQEEYNAYFKLIHLQDVHYPVAEFTSLIGFFLILFLEEIMSSCSNRQNVTPVLYLDDVSPGEEGSRAGLLVAEEEARDSAFEELKLEDSLRDQNKQSCHSRVAHSHSHSHSHALNSTGFSFFILMFATSIHSVFEGMALGLIKEYTRAVHLFIGIILHECIVAVALGLNSFRMQAARTSTNKFGLLFSATIPLGITIGVILGYTPGATGRLISAIFQGIAAGTFLHVAFCELIPSAMHADHDTGDADAEHGHPSPGKKFHEKRLFRVLLIFLGFAFMSVVTLFIDH